MKLALVGYGRMGREIEAVAQARGHEVVAIVEGKSVLCVVLYRLHDDVTVVEVALIQPIQQPGKEMPADACAPQARRHEEVVARPADISWPFRSLTVINAAMPTCISVIAPPGIGRGITF